MYIIGIDGGGTRTRVELRDEKNRPLGRKEYGAFNLASIGEAAFRQRISEILADAGGANQIASLCIGGAGVSGGAMETILREELEKLGFTGQLTLCGDHEIALAGAMEGAGCILIAGTGSICYGRNDAGETARSGGWGHLLDDCGSAYALGREALAAALRTEDGRMAGNALHNAVMAHLGAKEPADIIRFAYYGTGGKADIAALAPLILDCADRGDPVSLEILRAQSRELKAMVQAAASRLGLECPKLALLGGLLERDNVYSRLLREALADTADLVPPAHDALWGAAEMATKRWAAEKRR